MSQLRGTKVAVKPRAAWVRVRAAVVAAGLVAGLLAGPAAGSTSPARPYDFNGDRYADLAIGAPGVDVGDVSNAGAVNVLYGGKDGVSATGDQEWTQNTAGVLDDAASDDRFGSSTASGDFNRDGYADLAIGAQEDRKVGVVHVLYGTADGLSAAGNQVWREGAGGVTGSPEQDDLFGDALAAGDWNGDGFADLAIGIPGEDVALESAVALPGEDVERVSGAGAVQIIHGSAGGLAAPEQQTWSQESPGVEGKASERVVENEERESFVRYREHFGSALAAGDINGDAYRDLVVGVPGDNEAGNGAGAFHVLFGSAEGVTEAGDEYWHQDSPGVPGSAWSRIQGEYDWLEGEHFGASVAVGDFNGDNRDDVAAGAPNDSIRYYSCDLNPTYEDGVIFEEGSVTALYASGNQGLVAEGSSHWHPKKLDLPMQTCVYPLNSPYFGTAVAAGDVDGDGDDELAMGAPGLAVAKRYGAGGVVVLRGRAGGLVERGKRVWTQDTAGVIGTAEKYDHFGDNLAIRQLGRSGARDLVIGATLEDDGDKENAGRVSILYGSPTGTTARGDQAWGRDSRGVAGEARADDGFGHLSD